MLNISKAFNKCSDWAINQTYSYDQEVEQADKIQNTTSLKGKRHHSNGIISIYRPDSKNGF